MNVIKKRVIIFSFIISLQVNFIDGSEKQSKITEWLEDFEDFDILRSSKSDEESSLLPTSQSSKTDHGDNSYEVLEKGWKLCGLTDPLKKQNQKEDEMTLVDEFINNKVIQKNYWSTLEFAIDNDIDLDETFDPTFQYCKDTPFMKSVIATYHSMNTDFQMCPFGPLPRTMNNAVSKDNVQIMEFLLEVSSIKQSSLDKLLESAVIHNSSKIIPVLIARGANVQQKDERGCNLLHRAAANYAIKSIPALIPLIDINSKSNNEETPLHMACNSHIGNTKKNIYVLSQLINAQADINALSRNHNTPLHCLYNNDNDNAKVIAFLVAAGADKTIKNKEDKTPKESSQSSEEGFSFFNILEWL